MCLYAAVETFITNEVNDFDVNFQKETNIFYHNFWIILIYLFFLSFTMPSMQLIWLLVSDFLVLTLPTEIQLDPVN